VGHLSS